MLKTTALLFTIIALCFAVDPSTLVKQDLQVFPSFYENTPIKLYVLYDYYGFTEPPKHLPSVPVYVFIPPHGKELVQKNLIEYIPGDKSYSELWHVNIVEGRKPGDPPVKSVSELLELKKQKKVKIVKKHLFVNSHVVGEGSTIKEPKDAASKTAYYQGKVVNYFDFGVASYKDRTANIYHLLNSKGIIVGVLPNSIPGQKGYSALWNAFNVSVPDSLISQGITRLSQIAPYKKVFARFNTNCPISQVGDKPILNDLNWETKLFKK